jgi:glycosyltransferase involved in cell wall biosynthesis
MILALSHFNPYPPRSGGAIRVYNFLLQLSKFDTTRLLYVFSNGGWRPQVPEHVSYGNNFLGTGFRTSPILDLTMKVSPGTENVFRMSSVGYPPLFRNTVDRFGKGVRLLVLDHPYAYTAVREFVRAKYAGKIIYDAHNIEYDYQVQNSKYFRMPGISRVLRKSMFHLEQEVCDSSEVILVVSTEDKARMSGLYRVPDGKVHVLPNGVDTDRISPSSIEERLKSKARLGLAKHPVVVFMGSTVKPNLEAVEFIEDLAAQMEGCVFLIVGKAGLYIKKGRQNVLALGVVSEETKYMALAAADVAVNPVRFGTGSNVKMLEYMAAGLPVVSTPVGARGLHLDGEVIISPRRDFAASIQSLIENQAFAAELRRTSRTLAEQYNWRNLVDNAWSEALLRVFSS